MSTRETLHRLVDELPDDQAEDAAALASLDRGLADIAEGRTKPLGEYENERGL